MPQMQPHPHPLRGLSPAHVLRRARRAACRRAVPRALALTVAASLAAPMTATPYDGLYRPAFDATESWDCSSVGMDGGALRISEGELFGIDNPCTLTNPVEVRGMDAILYDSTCAGEGAPYEERVMLMRHQYGVYILRDGLVLDMLSCK